MTNFAVHKLAQKVNAEKQKYSDQKQHVWTNIYYLLDIAKHCATHHIHYFNCFSWKPYEVGIVSTSYREHNSFRKISCLPLITLQGRSQP